MKIAILQLNFIVGDLEGNANKIIDSALKAASLGAELCITPELALLGYPPRDFLLKETFIKNSFEYLKKISAALDKKTGLLIGLAEPNLTGTGKPLFNSSFLIINNQITARFHKNLLPTYDVFDEDRYFESTPDTGHFKMNNIEFGVTICEDIWNDKNYWHHRIYSRDPVEELQKENINILINQSASPFTVSKHSVREDILKNIARRFSIPVIYANQVGANDDLVFDGRSFVISSDGKIAARAKPFEEDILIVDLDNVSGKIENDITLPEEEIWHALVLGTRDYIKKCGFKKTLLGLSGGIDSSITAAIAAEAIGPENVIGVLMPSPYSSKGSIDDSLELAKNLGINTLTIPIKNIMNSFDETLGDIFKGLQKDITEENIQSRIRGNLLMALSNKYGAILLTTGNKSELAVGYCTIYGDMSGGLAVISDLPKTTVYKVSEWLNKTRNNPIPIQIIEKPPSAELRPDQLDQDSLPPYDTLDCILEKMIEHHKSRDEIISEGFDKEIVTKIYNLVSKAEFKRKQAAPGIKVTDRAFGTGWRMPVACRTNYS